MKKNALVFLTICLLVSAVFSQDGIVSYTKLNQQVPEFSIKDINGNDFKISDEKGKVVFVYFWTTWCPYCRTEMKFLEEEVWQKFKDNPNFSFIAIARGETNALITKYRKTHNISFPMAADPNGVIFKLFGNTAVPRGYLINSDGKIISQSIGLDIEEIKRRHNLLIKEIDKLSKKKNK